MAKIRTSLTVHASQRVTNNISRIVDRMASTCDSYNWVPAENLHITINHAGEVLDREAAEFCGMIKQFAKGFPAFELSLCGVDAFPNTDTPRTIWMGVDEGAEPLNHMNRELTKALQDWGFNKEKNAFIPHMVLGKTRRGGRHNDSLLELMHRLRHHDSGFCTVTALVVNSCHVDSGRTVFTPMATIPLNSDTE